VADFCSIPNYLVSYQVDPYGPEMILSEPSIIIIWTFQDISGHYGVDEQDIG
jgi:hypothetical protein